MKRAKSMTALLVVSPAVPSVATTRPGGTLLRSAPATVPAVEVVGPVGASRVVAEMCALGSNASIGLYRDVDHEGVAPAGVPVPDTC